MNIFEYAKEMEKDGEEYYKEMAQKINDKGVKRIFNMLARDEVKHYELFDKMQNEEDVELKDTDILTNSKNIFERKKENNEEIDVEENQIDIYRDAKEIEQESIDFYEEKAEEVDNDKYREIMLKIADEEKRHFHLIDNIEELLLRPQQWVEDAEFYHLEDY